MDTDELTRRLIADEGAGGGRALLAFTADIPPGPVDLELNVWTLQVDAGHELVHVEHDFDPLRGSVRLVELVAALGAAGLGILRQPPGTVPDRSRFGEGITEALLRDYVDEATRRGSLCPVEPEAIVCDLRRVIGTDVEGQPTRLIRVHVRQGALCTAYPV